MLTENQKSEIVAALAAMDEDDSFDLIFQKVDDLINVAAMDAFDEGFSAGQNAHEV